jgi:hypothetical protein
MMVASRELLNDIKKTKQMRRAFCIDSMLKTQVMFLRKHVKMTSSVLRYFFSIIQNLRRLYNNREKKFNIQFNALNNV